MKVYAIISALLCTAMALAQTGTAANGSGGFGPGSTYNKLWNGSRMITFNGTVTGRLMSPPMEGMDNAVVLLVKQPDRPAFEVHLGPQWFVSNLRTRIDTGDDITIIGSRARLENREIILAQTVIKGTVEVPLRDSRGAGMWIASQQSTTPPVVRNGQQEMNGEVIGRDTMTINGVEYNVYRVETPTGTMDVVGTPTWFGARQDNIVEVGHNVRILGARPPVQIGHNLFWADSFYTGGTVFVMNRWMW